MTAQILKLVPNDVGEAFKFEVNQILDATKERNLEQVVTIGYDENGELDLAGTLSIEKTLMLLHKAIKFIV